MDRTGVLRRRIRQALRVTPEEFVRARHPTPVLSAAAYLCLALAGVFGLSVGMASESVWIGIAGWTGATLYLITNGV